MVEKIRRHVWRKEMKHIIAVQSIALQAIHRYMHTHGFTQLMPVVLSKVTDPLGPDPESSVIKTAHVEYYGQRLKLTQSMILHKQIAVASGLKKVYIISPNVRLERKERYSTGRHCFEFSQVDFEIAYARRDDVLEFVEGIFKYILKAVMKYAYEDLKELGRKLEMWRGCFEKRTTHELEEVYGDEWEEIASRDSKKPFFALCFKREFYDKEDESRPGHYLNYDLIYPEGFGEALSGGEREYEYERIVERIRRDGLREEEYTAYLELAKEGMLIPSAGAGFGVERLVRYITGARHIKDVQLFPRVPGMEIFI